MRRSSGFTFVEMLITVLLVLVVFTGVGGALRVGKDSYFKMTKQAEARVLYSTIANVVKKDLKTATGIEDMKFYNQERKYEMEYVNTDEGIFIHNLATGSKSESLVSKKTKSNGLHGAIETMELKQEEVPYVQVTIAIVDRNKEEIYRNTIHVRCVNEEE